MVWYITILILFHIFYTANSNIRSHVLVLFLHTHHIKEEKMADFSKRYAGRVAVVTGAGTGLGKAIAARLLSEGCKVSTAMLCKMSPRFVPMAPTNVSSSVLPIVVLSCWTEYSLARNLHVLDHAI